MLGGAAQTDRGSLRRATVRAPDNLLSGDESEGTATQSVCDGPPI